MNDMVNIFQDEDSTVVYRSLPLHLHVVRLLKLRDLPRTLAHRERMRDGELIKLVSRWWYCYKSKQ